jgi:hypothetical protein
MLIHFSYFPFRALQFSYYSLNQRVHTIVLGLLQYNSIKTTNFFFVLEVVNIYKIYCLRSFYTVIALPDDGPPGRNI